MIEASLAEVISLSQYNASQAIFNMTTAGILNGEEVGMYFACSLWLKATVLCAMSHGKALYSPYLT